MLGWTRTRGLAVNDPSTQRDHHRVSASLSRRNRPLVPAKEFDPACLKATWVYWRTLCTGLFLLLQQSYWWQNIEVIRHHFRGFEAWSLLKKPSLLQSMYFIICSGDQRYNHPSNIQTAINKSNTLKNKRKKWSMCGCCRRLISWSSCVPLKRESYLRVKARQMYC